MPKTTIYKTDGTMVDCGWGQDEYPSLAWLQEAVGGYITRITINNSVHLYCDEEGELRQLPKNRLAHEAFGLIPGTPDGYLLGNVVCLRGFSEPKD